MVAVPWSLPGWIVVTHTYLFCVCGGGVPLLGESSDGTRALFLLLRCGLWEGPSLAELPLPPDLSHLPSG